MKQFYLFSLLSLFLLVPRQLALGNDNDSTNSARSGRWFLPHDVPVQFAGNIGLFSLGVGYTSNHENYQLSLLYGYVPASLALTDIHTVAARNIFSLTRYPLKSNRTLIPYLGLGLTVEVGGNAFFRLPSHFPDGYYEFPKNLHVIAYGGAKLQHLFQDDFRLLRGVEFYAEAGTVDAYVWYKTISSQIRFSQIFTLAAGVHLLLDH